MPPKRRKPKVPVDKSKRPRIGGPRTRAADSKHLVRAAEQPGYDETMSRAPADALGQSLKRDLKLKLKTVNAATGEARPFAAWVKTSRCHLPEDGPNLGMIRPVYPSQALRESMKNDTFDSSFPVLLVPYITKASDAALYETNPDAFMDRLISEDFINEAHFLIIDGANRWQCCREYGYENVFAYFIHPSVSNMGLYLIATRKLLFILVFVCTSVQLSKQCQRVRLQRDRRCIDNREHRAASDRHRELEEKGPEYTMYIYYIYIYIYVYLYHSYDFESATDPHFIMLFICMLRTILYTLGF